MIRFVKKYQNRKLYDQTQIRYITLNEIFDSVKFGDKFVITNRKSNDITAEILLKSIARNKNLGIDFCESLIKK